MPPAKRSHELYHEIFGSVIDRTEMTPYLFLRSSGYREALGQATRMMGNRGFDTANAIDLRSNEHERAAGYVRRARSYLCDWLFPFLSRQLERLAALKSANRLTYGACLDTIAELRTTFDDAVLCGLIEDDPRHLLLLASSRKYPHLFHGYRGRRLAVSPAWQHAACAILKTAQLFKSVEENDQDIHDYARLGMALESRGASLENLFDFNWDNPTWLPEDEPARRAFVKVSAFFHKMRESMTADPARGGLVFKSGDGVDVEIAEVKARLKSPESMITKLGKTVDSEAHEIRDILAVTFLLKSREDTLTLFHALQKRGVILQENTVSHSITQTLFDSPKDMLEAVRRLMINVARSEGNSRRPSTARLRAEAAQFFDALSVNAVKNPDSSAGHRKFQCKLNFAVPVVRDARTNVILVPGTPAYAQRDTRDTTIQQHSLGVELRISDGNNWHHFELRGESHHDAYRFRQLLSLMTRVFRPTFQFPREASAQLRKDQNILFA
jgi:uncharacterized protein (TIGR04562 family)